MSVGDECAAREHAAVARCHFVDVRAAFEGHPEYLQDDDVHPTDAGDRVIAQLIWQALEADVPYR